MAPAIAPKPAPAAAAAPQPRHMFVFGVGFVGRYVSERLLAQGWQVSGTCTSSSKKRELEALGMCASVFDATDSNLSDLHNLQDATHLLVSIPPVFGIGDPLLNLNEDLKSILSHGNLQWLCYLSSTSVYGDCFGALVDEDALDTIAKSRSLSRQQKLRESKQYTARIHVADIYQAVLASMSIRCARKIINVVDDDPAPRAEVFEFAKSLIESRYPDLISESIEVDSTGGSRERIIPAEKRVSNSRLKQELGVKVIHPTYKSGLQSIIDSWQVESKFPGRS